MNRSLATRLGAAALIAFGLGACGSTSQNAPQPAVTQVERVANDTLLITAIKAKLITIDPDSTASLGVHASDGAVTLTGTVRSATARSKAVAAARGVTGVHSVSDRLNVDPKMPSVSERVGDAAIAGRIAAAIFTQTGSVAVRVHVSNGIVTLSGHVVDPKIRDTAVATARNTSGVSSVVDHMGGSG